ncbi:MAG: hypothetical protein RIS64_3356 [Bacteroidota bacterium]|jgi:DNA-directed RNA polymerase specialized sigma24 family protein
MIKNRTQTRPYNNFGKNSTDFEQIRADLHRNDDTSFMDWMLEQYEDFVRRLKAVTDYQIDEDDAREIVLNVITKFKNRALDPEFRFENVESYLMVICVRDWYKALRRKGIEIPSGDIFVDGNAIYLEAELDTTPQELENERERMALLEAIPQLREDHRLIAEERYLNEKPSEWKKVAHKLTELDFRNGKSKVVSESAAKKRWAEAALPKLKQLCFNILGY